MQNGEEDSEKDGSSSEAVSLESTRRWSTKDIFHRRHPEGTQ